MNSITAHGPKLRSFIRPAIKEPTGRFSSSFRQSSSTKSTRNWAVASVTEDSKVVSVGKSYPKDDEKPASGNGSDDFKNPKFDGKGESDEFEKLVSRGINATIVLGMGTLAVTKLLSIDHDYWH
ncbi:hypothetical protein CRG98_026667, partial [Punica granatum]